MAYDKEFVEFAMDHLGMVAPVRTKRMFGCAGVWSDDHFFALVDGKKIYMKVDDVNRADYEAAGSTPFTYGDPPKSVNLWELPAGILDDPDQLASWVAKALDAARRMTSKRKR